ncbi:aminotransferase class IV [Spirosoma spitsbergense]|uniref:aminotransferase class IV n=1 Tax=Spirosoma spitsbergense TaxID=431554 RepID=UPI00037727E1|nr:aminotransferase class IV [Spirosoma spitsbergense]
MPSCLETICVRNRQLQHISAHNDRFNRTRLACWQMNDPARLEDFIKLPNWLLPPEIYKCRVTYGPDIETIEFEPYHIRPVQSLALVNANGLMYSHKYADRQAINNLFARRGSADDILLVRDGLLTDTSYANVALLAGNRWYTPAHPLLEGTQRARLLADGILHPADIRPADLPRFESIKLMNAMLDWEQTTPIPVQAIR